MSCSFLASFKLNEDIMPSEKYESDSRKRLIIAGFSLFCSFALFSSTIRVGHT